MPVTLAKRSYMHMIFSGGWEIIYPVIRPLTFLNTSKILSNAALPALKLFALSAQGFGYLKDTLFKAWQKISVTFDFRQI